MTTCLSEADDPKQQSCTTRPRLSFLFRQVSAAGSTTLQVLFGSSRRFIECPRRSPDLPAARFIAINLAARARGNHVFTSARVLVLSYAIAAAGVVLAGLSHWWLAPLLGDTPPVRLLLVVVVMARRGWGGLPGLFATVLGLLAIVAANDSPGDLPSLTNRLLRFGSLGLLITGLFKGIHAFRHRAMVKEQDLRRSERRYRRLVETAGEGIWAFEPDGSTSYANPRMGEMLGVPAGELTGRASEFLVEAATRATSGRISPAGQPRSSAAARFSTRRSVTRLSPRGRSDRMKCPRAASLRRKSRREGCCSWSPTSATGNAPKKGLRDAKEVAEAACQARNRFLAALSHELARP